LVKNSKPLPGISLLNLLQGTCELISVSSAIA